MMITVMLLLFVTLVSAKLKQDTVVNADTDDIKDSFIQPVPHKDNHEAFFIQTEREHVMIENIPVNVSTLVLLLTKRHKYQHIDLNGLWELHSLEKLWLTHKDNSPNSCQVYSSDMALNDRNGSFMNVKHLHINIRLSPESLTNMAILLTKSKYLEVLDFSGSWMWQNEYFYQIFPFISSTNLKAISLRQSRNFDSARNEGFQFNLTQLLLPLNGDAIQYIDLSYNNIISLQGMINSLMPNLRFLDLSYNIFLAEFYNAKYEKNLLALQVFGLHKTIENVNIEGQNLIFEKEICSNHNTELRKIAKRSTIQKDARNCFNRLNITINELLTTRKETFCSYVYNCVNMMYGQTALSNIPCDILPSFQQLLSYVDITGKCEDGMVFPISPNLKEINLNSFGDFFNKGDSNRQHLFCFGKNNLKKLLLRNNKWILSTEAMKWNKYSFSGLERLAILDVSENNFSTDLSNTFFQSFWGLKEFYAANNFLKLNVESVSDLFPFIEIFDVSYNKLTQGTFPNSFFKNAQNLTHINLRGNLLETLDLDIMNTPKLSYIDVSTNRIRSFSKELITNLTLRTHGPLLIDLRDNILSCGCKALDTIAFIKSSEIFPRKLSYQCINERDGVIKTLKQIDISELKNYCFPSHTKLIVITILTNGMCFLIIIMICLCYKYRYRIYTAYIHLKWYFWNNEKEGTRFRFDAFVAFCADDRFWVFNTLMKELEEKYGFHLSIHYRDFLPGDHIVDLIEEHIENSKNVIVILSNNSLKSGWTMYELKRAHEKWVNLKKKLIVVKLGYIKIISETDSLVKQLFASNSYIKWPEEKLKYNDGRTRKSIIKDRKTLFWAKLSDSLYGKTFTRKKLDRRSITDIADDSESPEEDEHSEQELGDEELLL